MIAADSVWTELQCIDLCLRLEFCDNFIFQGQELRKQDNCFLLSSDLIGDNLNMMSGSCGSLLSQDEKVGMNRPCIALTQDPT